MQANKRHDQPPAWDAIQVILAAWALAGLLVLFLIVCAG